jgi:hypothetical protein
MREGWLCPRCGKVNGPHVDSCDCEPQGEADTGTETIKTTPGVVIQPCVPWGTPWPTPWLPTVWTGDGMQPYRVTYQMSDVGTWIPRRCA